MQQQQTVIVIHGVGNPAPGKIEQAVRENLRLGSVTARVVEVNWNQVVSQPLHGRGLGFGALASLSRDLCRAADVGFAHGPHDGVGMPPKVRQLQNVIAESARVTMAVAMWLVPTVFSITFLLKFVAPQSLEWVSPVIDGACRISLRLAMAHVALLFLLLLMGGVLAVAYRRMALFLIAVRRALLIALQPVLLLGFLPFLLPWTQVWGYTLPLGLIATGAVFLKEEPLDESFNWILASFVVALMLPLIIHGLVGPTTKVLLDIFRYAGDPRYRTTVQRKVDAVVRNVLFSQAAYGEEVVGGGVATVDLSDSSQDRQVIVVGHSLGSVIAVDSLLNSDVWPMGTIPTLITMGSPLRRFFFRFFPGLFFPPSADEAAAALGRRFSGFRWFNVYRPFDYIGTRLGFTDGVADREASTRQFFRWFRAHPNYWGDAVVRNAVKDWWARQIVGPTLTTLVEAKPFAASPSATRYWLAPEPPEETSPTTRERFSARLMRALLLGVPPLVLLWYAGWAVDGWRSERARNLWLLQDGARAQASVLLKEEKRVQRAADAVVVVTKSTFHFKFRGELRPSNKTIVTERESSDLFDYDQFSEYMRNGDKVNGFFWRRSVDVRFDPSKPDVFVVEHHPPHYGWWATLKRVVGSIMLMLLFAVWTLMVMCLLTAWCLLLVGATPKFTGNVVEGALEDIYERFVSLRERAKNALMGLARCFRRP